MGLGTTATGRGWSIIPQRQFVRVVSTQRRGVDRRWQHDDDDDDDDDECYQDDVACSMCGLTNIW